MTGGQWFGVFLLLTGTGLGCGAFAFLDEIGSWAFLALAGGVAAIIFGALLTFSDNPHHLKEGYVVGRHFTPAHTNWTTQCMSTGKTTMCHPQPIYVSDDWTLKLRRCDEDRQCLNGTLHFDDSAAFDSYEVGDYYPAGVR